MPATGSVVGVSEEVFMLAVGWNCFGYDIGISE